MTTWLGRFRIEGTNWEGRDWYLAPGAVALAREVNELWPDSHGADGTVAGRSHAQWPDSDHGIDPDGIVRALDVGENVEDDGFEFAEMLRSTRDPRILYVLHENKIFSSYERGDRKPWEWAPLSIGHEGHVHVSFTKLADTDDTPWGIGDDLAVLTTEQQEDLANMLERLDAIDSGVGFVSYMVPWFRKLSGLTPEQLRELEESDEVEALEAKVEEIASQGYDSKARSAAAAAMARADSAHARLDRARDAL